jgi:NTP pyrophosphatase (non-canonical NTP hydrolase)
MCEDSADNEQGSVLVSLLENKLGASLTTKLMETHVSEATLEQLKEKLRQFAAERDWDQFHSPKNLSMALIAEAAELVEHFQWLTEEQSRNLSPEKLAEIALELADIQIYLVRLADKLHIGLMESVDKKLELNAKKYPADKVRGSSKKYTEYE